MTTTDHSHDTTLGYRLTIGGFALSVIGLVVTLGLYAKDTCELVEQRADELAHTATRYQQERETLEQQRVDLEPTKKSLRELAARLERYVAGEAIVDDVRLIRGRVLRALDRVGGRDATVTYEHWKGALRAEGLMPGETAPEVIRLVSNSEINARLSPYELLDNPAMGGNFVDRLREWDEGRQDLGDEANAIENSAMLLVGGSKQLPQPGAELRAIVQSRLYETIGQQTATAQFQQWLRAEERLARDLESRQRLPWYCSSPTRSGN